MTTDRTDSENDPATTDTETLTVIASRIVCRRLRRVSQESFQDLIPVEEPFAIFINGKHAVDVTISPSEIHEFVVGHLICEGHIDGPQDIENYSVGEGWAEVELRVEPRESIMRKVIFSACFGGSGRPPSKPEKTGKVESDLTLDYEQLQGAVEAIEDSQVHRLTGGVHTCGIFSAPERDPRAAPHRVGLCDDIGRHNALDKAVGKAAMQGCRLARCFVVTTGRASSEMVAKCHAAGIPVLASRGATTTLAVEIAKLSGIALVGFARRDRINIYCNEWRVLGAGCGKPNGP